MEQASGPNHPTTPSPEPPEATQRQSPVREITSEQAWAEFTAKTPFLDARFSYLYTKGHVQGAWNLPIAEASFDEHLVEFEVTVRPQPGAPVVVYCSGSDCPDSHHLATKLLHLGYTNILVYVDGYPDWVAKKRPVDKGDKQKAGQ